MSPLLNSAKGLEKGLGKYRIMPDHYDFPWARPVYFLSWGELLCNRLFLLLLFGRMILPIRSL